MRRSKEGGGDFSYDEEEVVVVVDGDGGKEGEDEAFFARVCLSRCRLRDRRDGGGGAGGGGRGFFLTLVVDFDVDVDGDVDRGKIDAAIGRCFLSLFLFLLLLWGFVRRRGDDGGATRRTVPAMERHRWGGRWGIIREREIERVS